MYCILWNYDGIIHFELVSDGHPITSVVYCQRLDRVHEIMQLINRKCVLLQLHNGRPHVANKTITKIDELNGFKLVPHPIYNPGLALPSRKVF